MPDIIQLLPDSVANQIAAGEVIQRPASVIKELVENAVDAGATQIKINVKDAGKTLIQIVDNGLGMSETDARMAFERHATSKIKNANDLFALSTKGFRGEALASVAAVAHVELKTRTENEEIGTHLEMAGSEVKAQEPVQTPVGSNFLVRNLFFNVPARRKFLKGTGTEYKHILNEFQRIALVHPDIAFQLVNDDNEEYNLTKSTLKQRIVNVIRKGSDSYLIPIQNETDLVKIYGYIGKPEKARKTKGEQYFFVNNRYMRHSYFYKAVQMAYENILPPDTFPSFFIYFDIPPADIDVNIHPTKTEIKFAEANAIFQILLVTVREALGKFNIMPSIDFDQSGNWGIPPMSKNQEVKPPGVDINPFYNPFEEDQNSKQQKPGSFQADFGKPSIPENWEALYAGFENNNEDITNQEPVEQKFESAISEDADETEGAQRKMMQVGRRYIITTLKSGMLIINLRLAQERILYEKMLSAEQEREHHAQQLLYPEEIELSVEDFIIFEQLNPVLADLGFKIEAQNDGIIKISGLPAYIKLDDTGEFIGKLLHIFKQTEIPPKDEILQIAALQLAQRAGVNAVKLMNEMEMQYLVDQLFACQAPNYSPTGKKIIRILSIDELDKLMA